MHYIFLHSHLKNQGVIFHSFLICHASVTDNTDTIGVFSVNLLFSRKLFGYQSTSHNFNYRCSGLFQFLNLWPKIPLYIAFISQISWK